MEPDVIEPDNRQVEPEFNVQNPAFATTQFQPRLKPQPQQFSASQQPPQQQIDHPLFRNDQYDHTPYQPPQSQTQSKPQPQPQPQPQQPQQTPQPQYPQQPQRTPQLQPQQPPQPQYPQPPPQFQPPAANNKSPLGGIKPGLVLKMVAIVVGIVLIIGVGLIVKSLFSTSNNIGELVIDKQDGISFLRPETWTKSIIEDEFAYFTEGGASIDDANRGLLVSSDFIGIKYESLGDSEKATIRESFETQAASVVENRFANNKCTNVGDNKILEVQQNGYDVVYLIEASCNRASTDEPGATLKMFIGWTDVYLHLFGLVADMDTWENDGEALDQIIESVRPANLAQ